MPELTENEQAAVDAFMGDEETGEVEPEVTPTPDEEPQETADTEPENEGDKVVPVKAVIEERRKRQELEDRTKQQAEELAQLRQQQDELRRSLEANRPVQPPKDIYEAYDRDPDGVVRDLNAEIKKLVAEDPHGKADQIEGLRDLKDELRRREVANITTTLSQQTQAQEILTKVHAAVPDFQSRGKDLFKFAIEELGYTPQEFMQVIDTRRGEVVVREWQRIDKLYQKLKATPEKKEARPRPTAVETPGRGVPATQPNHAALFEKAKRSGSADDWAAYLEAKGL